MSNSPPRQPSQDNVEGNGSYVDQEASGSTVVQSDSKRRRNRKPVTCSQCRKRKLKCDRGAPCGACRDRNEPELCEWDGAIRLPQSNYSRDQESFELRAQLDRLEGLLGVMRGSVIPSSEDFTNSENGNGRGGSVQLQRGGHDLDMDRTSAAEALGLLAGTSSSSGHVSNGNNSSNSHPLIFPLGKSPPLSLEMLIAQLPSRTELEVLLTSFLSDLSPLPILVSTSFRERYRNFERHNPRADPFFVALLLAIAGWETFWRSTDPRANGRSARGPDPSGGRVYLQAAMDALHLGGYLENFSIDSVRTLLVLHQFYTHQDSPAATSMLNLAIQTAQAIGLNRDPAPYQRFGYLEGEERRRLWTIIISHDWIESPGRTYVCSPSQHDTMLPANARDDDISESGITARPLNIPTPILYLLFRAQIASMARTITDRAFGVQANASWKTVMDLNGELSRMDSSLPSCFAFEWEHGAVKKLPVETFTLDFTRVQVHLLLRQQFIRLHRPFLTRGCADNRFAFSREKCCWAARYILAIHRGLGDDFRAARNWSIVFHTLNALCILAIDLAQDPRGSYSEIHRADIAASLKILDARPVKSPLIRETIRVVNVLLRHVMPSPESYKKRKHEDSYQSGSGAPYSKSSPHQSDSTPITARVFDPTSPFSRPLPLPISADPFAPRPNYQQHSNPELEFTNLWRGLANFRRMYATPDFEEWAQISGTRSLPWSGGIDLLQ